MMCSDPYGRPVAADIDVPGDGHMWVLVDCDGLPADWSWLPKVVGEMAAEGWPEGWYPCSGGETRQCCNNSTGWPWIVPNTEPGRRAAWAMGGGNEPRQ